MRVRSERAQWERMQATEGAKFQIWRPAARQGRARAGGETLVPPCPACETGKGWETLGWVQLAGSRCAGERRGKRWAPEGEWVQEKGTQVCDRRKMQGGGSCMTESRRSHSQLQLSSPELWDTEDEIEGKESRKRTVAEGRNTVIQRANLSSPEYHPCVLCNLLCAIWLQYDYTIINTSPSIIYHCYH